MDTNMEQLYAAAFDPINNLSTVFALLLMGSLSKLISLYHNFDMTKDQFTTRNADENTVFDFIIIGAGSAGSVVANRLSEEDFSVLLLEAGGEPSPLSSIPALTFPLLNQKYIDWRFSTTPQTNACLAMNNQQSVQPRGLGLGGSSNLNGMIYLRGHPKDFDTWASLTGDSRWSYEKILPVYKYLEDYHGKWENTEYHSKGGNLNIEIATQGFLEKTFVQAGVESGYEEADLNARFTNAFSPIFVTTRKGMRYGTFKAFIEPARSRRNLSIRKFAKAYKILFEGPENRAYAVQYERHGVQKIAFANKEIIISAGAIMTPHLLMHSGIGPRNHLESYQIPVIVDLPVGRNLQDHATTFIGPFLYDEFLIRQETESSNSGHAFLEEYRINGSGLLSTSLSAATAFLVSSFAKSRGEIDWPDIQLHLFNLSFDNITSNALSQAFNLLESVVKKYLDPVRGKNGFLIAVSASRPKGRGEITLASPDPNDYPLFNPNYLTEEEDVKVLIEGVQRAIKLVENTSAFQKINGSLLPNPFPGCEDKDIRSEEYLECYIRNFVLGVYHVSATCTMGEKNNKFAVLDSELRVFNTEALRVIDASIMPIITSGNTNAPSILIGEMGSRFIKEKWSVRKSHLS